MKPLVSHPTDQPLEACAEFKVGVRSLPYLADHGFQNMIVLPGSFYIDMALRMERDNGHRVPDIVSHANFQNPVILSTEDTVIQVEVRDRGDGRIEYSFYEGGGEDGGARSAIRQPAAKLEISRTSSTSLSASTQAFAIEAFRERAQTVIDSERFYKRMRENGNQYGPSFQNVSAIWRVGDQSLGRLSVTRQHRQSEAHYLHPSLLDSMTQLLTPLIMEQGKTFILRSIDKIEVINTDFPETLWGNATLLVQDHRNETDLVGTVRVFDQSGKPYLELSGVAFALLDRVGAAEKPAVNLVVAGNFTAEPLEDSLNFWGDHFGIRICTEFAPYNQVFQQLLDAGSAFRRNSDGINVILLALEEWATRGWPAGTTLAKERAQQCFGNRPRYVLPNGLEIVQLNQYETDYVFQEIFEDQCYLKHGIRLHDGDTVVDIGANIGLFSLFVKSRCQNTRIYAFEPAPMVYELLKANCDAYGPNLQAFNFGVSDKPGTATFTFYERSSVFSGFHSDETEDRAAIQTVVRNMLNGEAGAGEPVDEYVNELTADRLRRKTHECRLTCVSEIIRQHQIDTINLLKIDAEKSEWEILKGIADHDWPKISQIVVEIHDRTGAIAKQIEGFLKAKGYRCAVEHERLLEDSGLFNLYATREGRTGTGGSEVEERERSESSLKRDVGEFCTALRSFMSQATAPLVLHCCPRSPAAEINLELKAALNEAEEALLSEAGRMANVHFLSSASLLQRYPVHDYYDPQSHNLGHIPYTSECYAAIGTALVRTIYSLKGSRFKVIVLDCDNTLWKGVCGEEGPSGIEMTGPHRALQEFMIGQMNAGMLLCLCSKNNEKDVLEVFEQRTDMPLKREHLVSWRINWNDKSDNIKALASELNVGLDSFIFMDDNPVECADVQVNCPEVLTLQLPPEAESFPLFLKHIWAFDHTGVTGEDQNRTKLYQENSKRHQFREQSYSLKDFVNGLRLRVEIAEATEDQFGRVSQLTFRTNQFNFTTIRRSETEIKTLLNQERTKCLVVQVADRFGDYGLVGVVIYRAETDRFKVDTFLLSCRVLGRGVEHVVVSELGQRAIKEGKKFVEFTCLPTEKNQPSREFITRIGDQYGNDAGTTWTFPAEHLASVTYDPDKKETTTGREMTTTVSPEKLPPHRGWEFGVAERSERLQRIGEHLCDVGQLTRAIEEYRLGKGAGQDEPFTPALSPSDREKSLPTVLLNIWRKVLGKSRIGLNDNFFEAGGTSLRAVQVIATIKKELRQTLSIVSLFECPTVALLAAKLSSTTRTKDEDDGKAALRGGQRRYKTMKRQAV